MAAHRHRRSRQVENGILQKGADSSLNILKRWGSKILSLVKCHGLTMKEAALI